jgi:hypothetical protein
LRGFPFPARFIAVKQVRIHSSKGASLSFRWPAAIGGGALLWLLPLACSLSTEGENYNNAGSSGSPVTSSNGASSSSGSGVGGDGAGGAASSSGAGIGGAGGAGGGTGGGGPVVYEWLAVDPGAPVNPCTTTYRYTLPIWLQFASPTPGERTSQIAIDKLCRGYTMDIARARNVGKGWGLSVESERANLVVNSESWSGTGWGAGNMNTTEGISDPAGGVKATEFRSPASANGNYSNYPAPPIDAQVGSSWLRGSFGSPPYAHFRHIIDNDWVDVETDQWRRYFVAQTSNEAGDIAIETRDKPPGSKVITGETHIQAFGAQIEAGAKYPSSYIPTGAMPVTRFAERLSSEKADELIKDGWLDVEITIAPNYASDKKSKQHDILYFDDMNHLSIATDNKVEFYVADQLLETKEIIFAAEDEVLIIARNTPAGRSLTVKVNGIEADTTADMKQAVIPIPQTFYILGNSMGAQECADLRAIKFMPVSNL